jgi:DNA transformation protein
MADVFFHEYVLDQLAPFGGIVPRAMFGGIGLFKGGVMFGLIADGELFFKVDDANRADFEARKSEPFTYDGGGRTVRMSYWFVPEDVIEDAEALAAWAGKAHAAALRGRKSAAEKPKARRKGPRPPRKGR